MMGSSSFGLSSLVALPITALLFVAAAVVVSIKSTVNISSDDNSVTNYGPGSHPGALYQLFCCTITNAIRHACPEKACMSRHTIHRKQVQLMHMLHSELK
jgi:hypothetical protein